MTELLRTIEECSRRATVDEDGVVRPADNDVRRLKWLVVQLVASRTFWPDYRCGLERLANDSSVVSPGQFPDELQETVVLNGLDAISSAELYALSWDLLAILDIEVGVMHATSLPWLVDIEQACAIVLPPSGGM